MGKVNFKNRNGANLFFFTISVKHIEYVAILLDNMS